MKPRWLALALVLGACTDDLVAPPSDVRFIAVAVGGAHSCALDDTGRAWCWGANDHGQLGAGGGDRAHATPVAVAGTTPFRAIAAGDRHSCALDDSDRAWCWGANESGQLGDGTLRDRDVPGPVLLDEAVSRIAPGGSHSCATDRAGAIWCWGLNDRGQVGPGPARVTRPLRFEAAPSASAIAAGGRHSCALGGVGGFCWGENERLQLGGATLENSAVPIRIGGFAVLHALTAGRTHSCALTSEQRVLCWGANEQGQLGLPTGADAGTPVPPRLSGSVFTAVAAGPGGDLTCASTAVAVWCWGGLEDPRLGAVTVVPTTVDGLPAGLVGGVAVGGAHACALVAARVACWGAGGSGQLGDGRSEDSRAAVLVAAGAGG